MKQKVALIRPYFGLLPNHIDLALQSYAFNADYDWYIFTDDRSPREYPPNVFVNYTTFDCLKNRFQEHFDFPLALERPYKLSDYKPLYGHLFADYLKGYDFWGHFDPDVIFGHLNDFVSDELCQRHDKLFLKGHFSLYRNIPAVNLLYREKVAGCIDYRTVLTSERNRAFDERVDGTIAFFSARNLRTYTASPIADIYYEDYPMRLVGETSSPLEKSAKSCFAYEKGGIYRYYWRDGQVHKEEFMYIHLMRRKMDVLCGITDTYLIYGNAFREFEPITEQLLIRASRKKTSYRMGKILDRWWRTRFRYARVAWTMLVEKKDYRKFLDRLGRKTLSLLGLSGEDFGEEWLVGFAEWTHARGNP